MNTSQRILVVDDDHEIRDLLGKFLQKHGYRAGLAKNGHEMKMLLVQHSYDLIILDVMMPGDDGLTLCQQLRTTSHIPIIMLTAAREEVDRILGLEMGADDYLGKPFNPRELLARIKAILRRSNKQKMDDIKQPEHVCYHFVDWILDKTSRRLLSTDGVEIAISSGEFNLLLVLLEHPQQVLNRDQLLELTRNRPAAPFDRSIDIQISRLRQKLEQDVKNPTLIKTIRGGGYVLACCVELVKSREAT